MSDQDNSDCDASDSSSEPKWLEQGGFLLLLIGMFQAFYGLAFVCDEYFSGSLRILCEEFKIPPVVAGATIMAIGTSAPDLLIAMISLLVANSSLGLGSVIGSLLFNYYAICAGVVLWSKNGFLKLDPLMFSRETFSYIISLGVLMFVVSKGSYEKGDWDQCITISWLGSTLLLLGYIGYALYQIYGHFITIFIYGLFCKDPLLPMSKDQNAIENDKVDVEIVSPPHSSVSDQNSVLSDLRRTRVVSAILLTEEMNQINSISSRSVSEGGTSIAPDLLLKMREVACLPAVIDLKERPPPPPVCCVDQTHRQRTVSLDRPSFTVVRLLNPAPEVPSDMNVIAAQGLKQTHQQQLEASPAGTVAWTWFYFTLPLRYMIHRTIPDCSQRRQAYCWTLLLSCCWLGALAEVMVECITAFGGIAGVDPKILGFTLSAMGASLPTLCTAMAVSREGLGDMAIANALGSNTFSLYAGVGLPWLTWVLVTGKSYRGVQDEGILPMLSLMILTQLFTYFLILAHGFTLHKWMGYLFLLIYAVILFLICGYFVQ